MVIAYKEQCSLLRYQSADCSCISSVRNDLDSVAHETSLFRSDVERDAVVFSRTGIEYREDGESL